MWIAHSVANKSKRYFLSFFQTRDYRHSTMTGWVSCLIICWPNQSVVSVIHLVSLKSISSLSQTYQGVFFNVYRRNMVSQAQTTSTRMARQSRDQVQKNRSMGTSTSATSRLSNNMENWLNKFEGVSSSCRCPLGFCVRYLIDWWSNENAFLFVVSHSYCTVEEWRLLDGSLDRHASYSILPNDEHGTLPQETGCWPSTYKSIWKKRAHQVCGSQANCWIETTKLGKG